MPEYNLKIDQLEAAVLDMVFDNIDTGRYMFVEYDNTTKWVLSEIRKKLEFKHSRPPSFCICKHEHYENSILDSRFLMCKHCGFMERIN